MQTLNGEFLIYPNPTEILDRSPRAVLKFVLSLWETQLLASPPDLERLVGAGQLARLLEISDVESQLIEWLNNIDDEKKWDVAGLFLTGFWSKWPSPDERLILALVSAPEQQDSGARDSIITALALAHQNLHNKDLAVKLRARFSELWQNRHLHGFQSSILRTIRATLSEP